MHLHYKKYQAANVNVLCARLEVDTVKIVNGECYALIGPHELSGHIVTDWDYWSKE